MDLVKPYMAIISDLTGRTLFCINDLNMNLSNTVQPHMERLACQADPRGGRGSEQQVELPALGC